MKGRFSLAVLFVLVLAPASVALAAWTPQQPGWTVHEVPLTITAVVTDNGLGSMAIDPVSGDFFVVGETTSGGVLSLLRVSQSGQIIVLAPVPATSPAHPWFDAVHRVVFVRTGSQLERFDEHGAPLSSISAPPSNAIAVGSDGELYAVTENSSSPSGLRLTRYDSALSVWSPVRDVLAFDASSNFLWGRLPDQLTFDEAGEPFATFGGQLIHIGDDATVTLGYLFITAQLAVDGGLTLFGEALFDPENPGHPVAFANRPAGHGLFGVAIAPGPTVLFLDSPTQGVFALDVFTLGPTPSAKLSWGALKNLGH